MQTKLNEMETSAQQATWKWKANNRQRLEIVNLNIFIALYMTRLFYLRKLMMSPTREAFDSSDWMHSWSKKVRHLFGLLTMCVSVRDYTKRNFMFFLNKLFVAISWLNSLTFWICLSFFDETRKKKHRLAYATLLDRRIFDKIRRIKKHVTRVTQLFILCQTNRTFIHVTRYVFSPFDSLTSSNNS